MDVFANQGMGKYKTAGGWKYNFEREKAFLWRAISCEDNIQNNKILN